MSAVAPMSRCGSACSMAVDTGSMPIVQNLARLDEATLVACSSSVAVLDDVCSFRALDRDEYLDLNWAPAPLEQAARIAQVPACLLEGLARATAGGEEANAAYREMPDSIWEHPVTSLNPTEVRRVHEQLQELRRVDFLASATAPEALVRAGAELSPPEADPLEKLRPHFQALCDFYATAVERRLGVLMWWD